MRVQCNLLKATSGILVNIIVCMRTVFLERGILLRILDTMICIKFTKTSLSLVFNNYLNVYLHTVNGDAGTIKINVLVF